MAVLGHHRHELLRRTIEAELDVTTTLYREILHNPGLENTQWARPK